MSKTVLPHSQFSSARWQDGLQISHIATTTICTVMSILQEVASYEEGVCCEQSLGLRDFPSCAVLLRSAEPVR